MPASKTVVVSGSIAIDRIMSFSGNYSDYIYKDRLDSLSVSIFLDDLKNTYGGVGGNIAYSLALLGDNPLLLGSVGPDGLVYMEHLANQGVNIRHIHESEMPTATFNVITDGQQNQLGGFYPGAMFDSDTISLAPWKDDNVLIVLSPQDPKAMKRQVNQCAEWSLPLFYDISQQVTNVEGDDMKAGVESAELLILNDYELSVLAKKTGKSIEKIKKQVPIVITTLGKDGSVVEGINMESPAQIGIVPPRNVIDPTGAGDAYRAGFLYGYARGWPTAICAKLGATTSAFAVEIKGPQEHYFTPDEVEKRFAETFKGENLPEKIQATD